MTNPLKALLLSTALLLGTVATAAIAAESGTADRVYRNGIVFTADAKHSRAEALAILDGRIVYVGSNQGLDGYVGPRTVDVDLKGRFLMPGVIDGHMHPLEAGAQLLKCNLNYESLTVAELQARVQACLDATTAQEPDGWLEVVNWFQETMRPAGVRTGKATLDGLRTRRPIIVLSSQGHTGLTNSRALALAKIDASTQDPAGGKFWRDATGRPTGLLEEAAAFSKVTALLPTPTLVEDVASARAALTAMNRQGVTSFLDAIGPKESIAAFSTLRKARQLTARAHFAPEIAPSEVNSVDAAVARVVALRRQYDEGALVPAPGITVRNAKLFLDGVIYVPAFTGAMVDPYLMNAGTAGKPRWIPGTSRGPAVYFPPGNLAGALVALGRAGIDPHMHADGDGAVRAALDAIAALRAALPAADIRPAIAHDEIVSPADFPRFKALNAIPVLSFQWEQPAGYTLGLKDYFGPARMKILEPAGVLEAAGARIAFGSDWPVDALDEWFAFKVGVARTTTPNPAPEYRGRLGEDPGLSPESVLRAATINAAYELHQDEVTGSLEVGKFADLVVLDRNPLTVPAEDIATTRVIETLVGGAVVYAAPR
jgi:predicted amidohydrolase YtcJ